MASLLGSVKHNLTFLERLVMDPNDTKLSVAHDLLAHAKRRGERDHHVDLALHLLLRALEAYAQHQLWDRYEIKSWDVQVEQLPPELRNPVVRAIPTRWTANFICRSMPNCAPWPGWDTPWGKPFCMNGPNENPLGRGQPQRPGSRLSDLESRPLHAILCLGSQLTNVTESDVPTFPTMTL